jgi:hypothetical protein
MSTFCGANRLERRYWGTSAHQALRPPLCPAQIDTEPRVLIRRMSTENPLWGAPRIHGELLKHGFEVVTHCARLPAKADPAKGSIG